MICPSEGKSHRATCAAGPQSRPRRSAFAQWNITAETSIVSPVFGTRPFRGGEYQERAEQDKMPRVLIERRQHFAVGDITDGAHVGPQRLQIGQAASASRPAARSRPMSGSSAPSSGP